MLTPHQLADDLRPTVRGAVHVDPLSRGLYATDASPFQVTPLAVAVPADEADVCALVAHCHAQGVPLAPRGAGTGLAGESLTPGVAVDLSVHFRKVLEVGPDWVRVQPGVTLAELNAELKPHGRRFAPDSASRASCTVGGMVGTNASGGTAYRHGYTRDHVRGLRVVWDDGTAEELPAPPLRFGEGAGGVRSGLPTGEPHDPSPNPLPEAGRGLRSESIRPAVAALLAANRELIERTRPRTRFNRCGYLLHDLDTPAGPDLAKLLVGSEGTLAVVTEATLATVPLPGGVAVAVLGFPTLDAGVRAALDLRDVDGVVGCDLLDQRMLSLPRGDDALGGIPAGVGAAAVVLIEADTEREAVRLGRLAVDRLRSGNILMPLAEPAADPAGLARVRRFRDAAVYGLYALPGRRPEAFVEDVGVPPDELAAYLAGVQDILRTDGLTASFLIHALTGQVHTRPLVDLTDPADRDRLWPAAEKIHALALALNGTVSTQHGVGLARTPWVEKQYGPLLPVFRELKRIFDPKGILNPGKILGPDPSRPAWPLRSVPSPAKTPLLIWSAPPATEAAKCNGCGDCRPRGTAVRMCPIFRATGIEAATPRAKANLLRVLTDTAEPSADDVRAVAGLCVGCRMCKAECRAGVDVPKLMLEAKAAHHAEHGFDRHQWALARADTLSALGGTFAFTANTLLGMRWSRWLAEKLFGVSRRVSLPRFTHRTFLRRAWGQGLTRRPRASAADAAARGPHAALPTRVAYFADTFANAHDPLLGLAAVGVLKRAGFEVLVPWKQRASGLTPLTHGDADAAREYATYNLRTLAELVRDGYAVVCSEPSAVVALTVDYPALVAGPDAELVAANTVELTALLLRALDAGKLSPPTRELPAGVGHHVPCHVKAFGSAAGPRLLSSIPGMRVHPIDVGCSGMAGTWGLAAVNRETSVSAGRAMIDELDRPRVLYGSTECSACRIQMQDATGKRTLHPVQWLAVGYGLLPQLEQRLTRPVGKLLD